MLAGQQQTTKKKKIDTFQSLRLTQMVKIHTDFSSLRDICQDKCV